MLVAALGVAVSVGRRVDPGACPNGTGGADGVAQGDVAAGSAGALQGAAAPAVTPRDDSGGCGAAATRAAWRPRRYRASDSAYGRRADPAQQSGDVGPGGGASNPGVDATCGGHDDGGGRGASGGRRGGGRSGRRVDDRSAGGDDQWDFSGQDALDTGNLGRKCRYIEPLY